MMWPYMTFHWGQSEDILVDIVTAGSCQAKVNLKLVMGKIFSRQKVEYGKKKKFQVSSLLFFHSIYFFTKKEGGGCIDQSYSFLFTQMRER